MPRTITLTVATVLLAVSAISHYPFERLAPSAPALATAGSLAQACGYDFRPFEFDSADGRLGTTEWTSGAASPCFASEVQRLTVAGPLDGTPHNIGLQTPTFGQERPSRPAPNRDQIPAPGPSDSWRYVPVIVY